MKNIQKQEYTHVKRQLTTKDFLMEIKATFE